MKMVVKKVLSILTVVALVSPLLVGTARADWDDHRGHGWEREHREHAWREHAYRRVYDWRMGRYVMMPIYASAPVYAYPAPQQVYAAPIYDNPAPFGLSVGVNIR